jgi:hypothetical protein
MLLTHSPWEAGAFYSNSAAEFILFLHVSRLGKRNLNGIFKCLGAIRGS